MNGRKTGRLVKRIIPRLPRTLIPVMQVQIIKVRDRRKALGLSQQQLAIKVGISGSAISDIENNRHDPSIWIAMRIAKVLGCSVYDLFLEKTP